MNQTFYDTSGKKSQVEKNYLRKVDLKSGKEGK